MKRKIDDILDYTKKGARLIINKIKGLSFSKARVPIVLGVSILVAFIFIVMKPERERIERVEKGLLVEVISPKPQTIKMAVETYGTVKSREMLKLIAEVNGRIAYIHPSFVEGGFAKKGTCLLEIDPEPFKLRLKQRKAESKQVEAQLASLAQTVSNLNLSIEIAKNDVNLAKAEFFRSKGLFSKEVVAKTTLDKAEQIYLTSLNRLQELVNQLALIEPKKKQFEAQKDMAQAAMEQAVLDLKKTTIEAPFSGWVLEKNVKKGQYVNVGGYIGNIYKKDMFDVDANIPVKELKWLIPLLNENQLPEAVIVFGEGENRITWPGKVVRTKSEMDQRTRTLPFVVEINDSCGSFLKNGICLRPGMFVTVSIKGEEIKNVYVLPRHMVYEDDIVYLIENGRLKERKVEVLRKFKESVYITGGLKDDDLVVKTNIPGAVDGMQLRMAEDKK